MRHKKIIIIFTKIVSLLVILQIYSPLMAEGEIYAVGCLENYPYEYINEEGIPAGFSVDLINETAKELKLKCRVELVPYERYKYLKNNREVDIILGMIRGVEDREYSFLRANVKIHFSLFSNSDSVISSINDLQDLKILIAASDFLANPILGELKKFLKFKSILSDDEINAFTLLKRKECDAVFMSGPSARKIIEHKSLIGVKEIPVSIGFFDYGFGIRKNKPELQALLTEGYNRVFAGGIYGNIYSRWFVEKPENSLLGETGVFVSTGVFSLMIFVLFLLINSFVLRKRIKEKTAELNLSLNELSKTQVQLRESEKRFKGLFNKSPSGLMILDSSGRVILFNEAVINIFGVNNPHEISNLDILNSPLSTEWFKTRLKDCRHVNLDLKFDFELIKKTGYYSTSRSGFIILELIVIPVDIYSGSPEPGYICQFSDKTNERKLLEEIKYNQSKLELIFEAVKDGLWEWNLITGKVRYNRKFFSFLGYKMESCTDDIETLLGFIHEDERESVKNELYEKVLNGRSFNIEYRMIMNNGKIITVKSRGEIIEWDDNLKPVRVIGIQSEVAIRSDICTRINLFKNDIVCSGNQTEIECDENILNGRTILIVDDNYLIFLHISELLKKYGTRSIYAASGLEAIDIVETRDDISLIILDHDMPGLDGSAALKEIRQIKNSIPVVIQTGHVNETVNNRFFMEGFNGVLGKPVEENLLIETICSIIETAYYSKNSNND
jgi:CheY-like chemotaxis protein/PAS domain-containing protein